MKLTLETLHMYVEEVGDCWIWRYGCNGDGYPFAYIEGKRLIVRRYIVECLKKQKVPKNYVISCRCGQKLCLNPDHLVAWPRAKIVAAGAKNRRPNYPALLAARLNKQQTVLDWAKVRAIRAVPASVSSRELAKLYGCHKRTIENVRNGRTWKDGATVASVWGWRPANEEREAA